MATAKKKTTTKKTTKKAVGSQRSFVRSKEPQPFLTFRPGVQSVYWLIIGVLVLALGVWTITLTVRTQSLYDQIHTMQADAKD